MEELIETASLGPHIPGKHGRIKQLVEPGEADQPIGCRRLVEPRNGGSGTKWT
jgi:hypothetical protein